MQKTKRNKEISKTFDNSKEYSIEDAIKILKENSKVKFVESLDCAIRLGVDPRHADQMVRGTVSLPHGTGKQVRVLVIAILLLVIKRIVYSTVKLKIVQIY